jgi:hypothetical protein
VRERDTSRSLCSPFPLSRNTKRRNACELHLPVCWLTLPGPPAIDDRCRLAGEAAALISARPIDDVARPSTHFLEKWPAAVLMAPMVCGRSAALTGSCLVGSRRFVGVGGDGRIRANATPT